jgi:gluconate kinase
MDWIAQKSSLLQSQFEALEEPQYALVLEASMQLSDMLDTIMTKFFSPERSSKLWD